METKELVSTHVFHKPMNLIWTIIRDFKLVNQLPESIKKNVSQEPIFSIGNNSYEQGAVFYYHFKNGDDLYYTVEECYETDYTTKIQWKITNTQAAAFSCVKTITLTYIDDYSTLLICRYSFEYDTTMKNIIFESEKSRKQYYYNLEKGIAVKKFLMTNYAGIKINANFSIVKQFLETPQIVFAVKGKLIRSTNKEVKKGTILIGKIETNLDLFRKCGKEYEINAIIHKISSHKEFYAVRLFLSNNTNALLPNRELIIQLYYLNDNQSYVVMRHNFNCEIGENQKRFLNDFKEKFLVKFKAIVEKMTQKQIEL